MLKKKPPRLSDVTHKRVIGKLDLRVSAQWLHSCEAPPVQVHHGIPMTSLGPGTHFLKIEAVVAVLVVQCLSAFRDNIKGIF